MSKLQTKWIEDGAITAIKLNADVKSPSTDLGTDGAKLLDRQTLQKVLDNFQAGLDVQEDVLGVQADATLDPGATPGAGDRYIITAPASLHANFGTIAGLEAGDIVEFDGSTFVVMYDVSVKEGVSGSALAWDRGAGVFLRYDATAQDWVEFGGMSGVTAGDGISKTGDVISAEVDGVSVYIDGSGKIAAVQKTGTQKMFAIDAPISAAGYFELPVRLPASDLANVTVQVVGGSIQVNQQAVGTTGATPDFAAVNPGTGNTRVHINANGGISGLTGVIADGDTLVVVYPA